MGDKYTIASFNQSIRSGYLVQKRSHVLNYLNELQHQNEFAINKKV